MTLHADIKALFEAFKSAQRLPKDVIWRTINGARVAISPRSGMVMAGPEALYGKRLNRGPIKVMHEGRQLSREDVERLVDTMTVDDVRKIESDLRQRYDTLTKEFDEQRAQSDALGWMMRAVEDGLSPEGGVAFAQKEAAAMGRRDRKGNSGEVADAFITGDDQFAKAAREAHEKGWAEAQQHFERMKTSADDKFLQGVEIQRYAGDMGTPRVWRSAVPSDFSAEKVLGLLQKVKAGDDTAAKTAADILGLRSPDSVISLVKKHPLPSAEKLAAYAEGDRDAKLALRRARAEIQRVSTDHAKRAYAIDDERDTVMRAANRTGELKRAIRKGQQEEGVMGRHWGVADTSNNTALGVVSSGGQRFRPIDKDMRNTTVTTDLSTAALGVLRRRYAQNQLASVPIEQEPALYRGMSIGANVVKNIVEGRTKSIRLTGATAFGMSEDVATYYSTSEHTQQTNTASQLRAGTRSVVVRMARNEAVDRSIGMYHPWSKAAQEVRSMGFREAPAYEVVSDLSRVKISKVEDRNGIIYIDVEPP